MITSKKLSKCSLNFFISKQVKLSLYPEYLREKTKKGHNVRNKSATNLIFSAFVLK